MNTFLYAVAGGFLGSCVGMVYCLRRVMARLLGKADLVTRVQSDPDNPEITRVEIHVTLLDREGSRDG